MRVLVVIETLGLIGGTERYASLIVPALTGRGHRVSVLCAEDLSGDSGDPPPCPVQEVRAMAGHGLAAEDRREVARAVGDERPDVVYMLTARNPDVLEVVLSLAPVVRFVQDHTLFCPGLNKVLEGGELCTTPMGAPCLQRYWTTAGCHGYRRALHENPAAGSIKLLGRKMREVDLHGRVAHLVTNSRYMRGELQAVGFTPEQVTFLPYFTRSNTSELPPRTPPEATVRFLSSGSDPVLFTPARLTLPDKGVDYLLTALGDVEHPFRAVVAGSGPAEAWLREKARDEGLGDRVHFAGWLDAGSVETLYATSRAVVCPSVWNEPFGLVGLEAMAHALPTVAFSVGGIPEWLQDGVNGILVERKDTAAMARALDRLLADETLARKMGEAGRERLAREFTREGHLDLLLEILARAA